MNISYRNLIITIIASYFVGFSFAGLAMHLYHNAKSKHDYSLLIDSRDNAINRAAILNTSAIYRDQEYLALSAALAYALENKDYEAAKVLADRALEVNLICLKTHSDNESIRKYIEVLKEGAKESPSLQLALEKILETKPLK